MIAKRYRIRRESISFILKKGGSFFSKLFIVRFIKTEHENNRFTTVVSKKISKRAVDRNKIRRRIYESIRLQEKLIENTQKFDIILIPKKEITEKTYQEIETDIKNIFTSANFK